MKTKTTTKPIRKIYIKLDYDRSKTIFRKTTEKLSSARSASSNFYTYKLIFRHTQGWKPQNTYVHWKYALPRFIDGFGIVLSLKSKNRHSAVERFLSSLPADMSLHKPMLFYSKCTGYTVCLTHSDISLSMYINQY